MCPTFLITIKKKATFLQPFTQHFHPVLVSYSFYFHRFLSLQNDSSNSFQFLGEEIQQHFVARREEIKHQVTNVFLPRHYLPCVFLPRYVPPFLSPNYNLALLLRPTTTSETAINTILFLCSRKLGEKLVSIFHHLLLSLLAEN